MADDAAPDQTERRRANDAERRHAIGHQREIDSELVAARDELLGSIQRIDQEEAVLERRGDAGGAFFRQHADVRTQPRQAIRDDAVGGEVGLCYRRAIGFLVDVHGAAPNRADRHARFDHQCRQRFDQRQHGGCVDGCGRGGWALT